MLITMPPKTRPAAIVNRLSELTDGTFEVIAVEVFDHPLAVKVEDGARFGGDAGPTTLGFWVLGPTPEVHNRIAAEGWDNWSEQYSEGGGE